MTFAKPCIVCGKVLPNVQDDAENQPYEGTAFTTHGHYGSTVFDPMDGSFLEIIVCDDCLEKYRDRVMFGRDSKPVMYEGAVVGSCKTPGRPLMDWTGMEGTSYDEGAADDGPLHLDREDLQHPELFPEITFSVKPADLLKGTDDD